MGGEIREEKVVERLRGEREGEDGEESNEFTGTEREGGLFIGHTSKRE